MLIITVQLSRSRCLNESCVNVNCSAIFDINENVFAIIVHSWIGATPATVLTKLDNLGHCSEDKLNICMMKFLLLVTLCFFVFFSFSSWCMGNAASFDWPSI